jgi:hypothetical protein
MSKSYGIVRMKLKTVLRSTVRHPKKFLFGFGGWIS